MARHGPRSQMHLLGKHWVVSIGRELALGRRQTSKRGPRSALDNDDLLDHVPACHILHAGTRGSQDSVSIVPIGNTKLGQIYSQLRNTSYHCYGL